MKLTTIISALGLAAVSQLANAAPNMEARDVWDPKITYPNSYAVWYAGSTYTVTWYVHSWCSCLRPFF